MIGDVPEFRRIMLVDDEGDIAFLFELMLRRAFREMKVDVFTNTGKALQHLRHHNLDYELLISDVRMPEVTGFMLAREAKKLNPSIIVMLMSAFEIATGEFSKVLPTTSVDDFIKKPVTTATFVEAVKRNISKLRSRETGEDA